jgi:hypothetical protein
MRLLYALTDVAINSRPFGPSIEKVVVSLGISTRKTCEHLD